MAKILVIEADDAIIAKFLNELSAGAAPVPTATVTIPVNGPVTFTEDADGPVNTSDTDSKGIVWDARYHASTRTTNQDGTWKAKRGMTDAEKQEAEAYNNGKVVEAEVIPVAPVVPVIEPVAAPVAPVTPAAPVTAPVGMPGFPMPTAPVVEEPVSMDEILALFARLVSPEIIAAVGKDYTKPEYYNELYGAAGIPLNNINSLSTDETLRSALKKVILAVPGFTVA